MEGDTSRRGRRSRPLAVQRRFEGSRLKEQIEMAAYQLLVPGIRRSLKLGCSNDSVSWEPSENIVVKGA